MHLTINPKHEYPWDKEKPAFGSPMTDKEVFEFYSTLFDYTDEPKYKNGNTKEVNMFKWDIKKLDDLNDAELCETALYLATFAKWVLEEESFDVKEFYNYLTAHRNITKEKFLKHVWNFQFPKLKEESSNIVIRFANTLSKEDPDYYDMFEFRVDDLYNDYHFSNERNSKYAELFEKTNQNKKEPFNLEHIIDLPEMPATITHDDRGRLFVLLKNGKLQEYQHAQLAQEWQLPLSLECMDGHMMFDFGLALGGNLSPNILVRDNLVYVAAGLSIKKYYLNDIEKSSTALVKGKQALFGGKNIYFHDVVALKDSILLSVSNEVLTRGIVQIFNEINTTVFEGDFPVNLSRSDLENLTLNIGVHEGNLYFPEGNGLGVYTEEGVHKVISSIVAEENYVSSLKPMTRFTFSDEYLIGMFYNRNDHYTKPLLGFFRANYGEGEGLIKKQGQIPVDFDLEYVKHIPILTGKSIIQACISAYQDTFAISDPTFNKVFLYRKNNTN